MTVVDFIIIIICLFFTLQGIWKGFMLEFFSLLALVTGLVTALNFYPLAAVQVQRVFTDPTVRNVTAFGIVFVAVWLAIKAMGWSLKRNLGEETNPMSRLAGAVFGLVKSVLVVSLIVYMSQTAFPGNKITGPNKTTPACMKIVNWTQKHMPFLPNR
jgi:membrane protein required for colicin V production